MRWLAYSSIRGKLWGGTDDRRRHQESRLSKRAQPAHGSHTENCGAVQADVFTVVQSKGDNCQCQHSGLTFTATGKSISDISLCAGSTLALVCMAISAC